MQSLCRRRDGHVEAIRQTASGSEIAADQTLSKATAGHADDLRGGSSTGSSCGTCQPGVVFAAHGFGGLSWLARWLGASGRWGRGCAVTDLGRVRRRLRAGRRRLRTGWPSLVRGPAFRQVQGEVAAAVAGGAGGDAPSWFICVRSRQRL